MAMTAQGDALTIQYRKRMQAIRAQTIRDLLAVWPMLDKANIDATQRGYLIAVRAIVKDRRRAAALLSANYYSAFRTAEGVSAAYSPLMFDEIVTDVLETALRVTGPIAFKRAIAAGKSVDKASETALVLQAGSVSRLVLDGGRETIGRNMERDKTAIGWQRVTDGKPCYFCAMLASRGAVYRTEHTALYAGGRKYHDHCGCTVEPMYDRAAPISATNLQFAEKWRSATAGHSGQDAVNAFRKVIGKG